MSAHTAFGKLGSNFVEVEKMTPIREEPHSVIIWSGTKAVIKILIKETGIFTGLWILFRTVTLDFIFNPR